MTDYWNRCHHCERLLSEPEDEPGICWPCQEKLRNALELNATLRGITRTLTEMPNTDGEFTCFDADLRGS